MSDDPNQSNLPQAEQLQPKQETVEAAAENSQTTAATNEPAKPASPLRSRTASYRPSHKATFVGIGVVVGILALNAGVIAYFMNAQNAADATVNRKDVTLSSSTLNSLGVSRNPVGVKGTQLTIGPDTQFNGEVTIGGNVRIQGNLQLKNAFTAPEGSFTSLKAGKTALGQLNVNGDATVTNLVMRKNLTVAGSTRLQGTTTITGLTSLTNSLNVSGNVAVGGSLSVRNFQANTLTSSATLKIGGHIVTRGQVPSFTKNGGISGVATISGSGNDAAGTVNITLGVGASAHGSLVTVDFVNGYDGAPRVLITPFNDSLGSFYVTRSSGGFTVFTNSTLNAGSYGFDYFVVQ